MHLWTNARRFSFEIPLGLSSSLPMSAIVVWTSSEWPSDRRELFSASTSANLPLHILSYRMCLLFRKDIVAAANFCLLCHVVHWGERYGDAGFDTNHSGREVARDDGTRELDRVGQMVRVERVVLDSTWSDGVDDERRECWGTWTVFFWKLWHFRLRPNFFAGGDLLCFLTYANQSSSFFLESLCRRSKSFPDFVIFS